MPLWDTEEAWKIIPSYNMATVDVALLPFVIESEVQYHQALKITEQLFFKQDRTGLEEQILQVWTVLIEMYEEQTFRPGDVSTPVSTLKFLMESQNLIQADLVRAGIGSSGIVSEIVNGKRQISKDQAKKLANLFHVSSDLFI